MKLVAFFILLALLVGGCTPLLKQDFPQYCDMTQPDKDGRGGFTRGVWPCQLTHTAAPETKVTP